MKKILLATLLLAGVAQAQDNNIVCSGVIVGSSSMAQGYGSMSVFDQKYSYNNNDANDPFSKQVSATETRYFNSKSSLSIYSNSGNTFSLKMNQGALIRNCRYQWVEPGKGYDISQYDAVRKQTHKYITWPDIKVAMKAQHMGSWDVYTTQLYYLGLGGHIDKSDLLPMPDWSVIQKAKSFQSLSKDDKNDLMVTYWLETKKDLPDSYRVPALSVIKNTPTYIAANDFGKNEIVAMYNKASVKDLDPESAPAFHNDTTYTQAPKPAYVAPKESVKPAYEPAPKLKPLEWSQAYPNLLLALFGAFISGLVMYGLGKKVQAFVVGSFTKKLERYTPEQIKAMFSIDKVSNRLYVGLNFIFVGVHWIRTLSVWASLGYIIYESFSDRFYPNKELATLVLVVIALDWFFYLATVGCDFILKGITNRFSVEPRFVLKLIKSGNL